MIKDMEEELSNIGLMQNGIFAWRKLKVPYRFFKNQRLIEEEHMPKNQDAIKYYINSKYLDKRDQIIYKN